MKKITLFAASLLLLGGITRAQEPAPYPQITNIGARSLQSLDGGWNSLVDLYEVGAYNYRGKPNPIEKTFFMDRHFFADETKLVEYDFDVAPEIKVPGDWNTQRMDLYRYEGTVWYRRTFEQPRTPGKRYFVYFGAANYATVAALNGKILGKHVGGFTPFNFEITDLLREGANSLVVKVDNRRHLQDVPTVDYDWWNYGGITRSVYVVETPETFIRDYCIRLKKVAAPANAKAAKKAAAELKKYGSAIEGWIQFDGPAAAGKTVTVAIPDLKVSKQVTADENGLAKFEFRAKVSFWSPEFPKLYGVSLTTDQEELKDRVGFRTIEARGNELYLNGKKIFCRGVSVHEEKPFNAGGRANSKADAQALLGWVKEMNGNFVRLAHYPHNENMIRAAEEMGIMVWSEVPVYWFIDWTNPETYANAENQLTENITRDRNRANIIIWSVANETPIVPHRLEFLSGLVDKAHEMDPTRLVSAAMEKEYINDNTLTCNDPLAAKVDLMSFNEYVGWYDGNVDKCDRVNWVFDIKKPVFISEFGGGAPAGRHGDKYQRFTEENQEYLYQKSIGMLTRMEGLAGATPWILKDFRSPKRFLTGVQDDYNRKGLVSENGEKKKAFFVMQNWYAQLKEQYESK